MNTIEDTFNALRRSPIQQVDNTMLAAFNATHCVNYIYALDYELSGLTADDLTLFNSVLELHYWNREDYLKHTAITFVF